MDGTAVGGIESEGGRPQTIKKLEKFGKERKGG